MNIKNVFRLSASAPTASDALIHAGGNNNNTSLTYIPPPMPPTPTFEEEQSTATAYGMQRQQQQQQLWYEAEMEENGIQLEDEDGGNAVLNGADNLMLVEAADCFAPPPLSFSTQQLPSDPDGNDDDEAGNGMLLLKLEQQMAHCMQDIAAVKFKMPEFAVAKHVKKLTQDVFKINCALQKLEREHQQKTAAPSTPSTPSTPSSPCKHNNENSSSSSANITGVVSKLVDNVLDITKRFKEYRAWMDKRMEEKDQRMEEQAGEIEELKQLLVEQQTENALAIQNVTAQIEEIKQLFACGSSHNNNNNGNNNNYTVLVAAELHDLAKQFHAYRNEMAAKLALEKDQLVEDQRMEIDALRQEMVAMMGELRSDLKKCVNTKILVDNNANVDGQQQGQEQDASSSSSCTNNNNSEGTITLRIKNINEFANGSSSNANNTDGNDCCRRQHTSEAVRIRGIEWKILAIPSEHNSRRRAKRALPAEKCLGYFLQCIPDGMEKDARWSCACTAKLKILAPQEGKADHVREIDHVFHADQMDWGYTRFMTLETLMDHNHGWYDADAFTLAVDITAQAPMILFKHGHPRWCPLKSPANVELLPDSADDNRLCGAVLRTCERSDWFYGITTPSAYSAADIGARPPGCYGIFYFELIVKELPKFGWIALGFNRNGTRLGTRICLFGNKCTSPYNNHSAYWEVCEMEEIGTEGGEGEGNECCCGVALVMPPVNARGMDRLAQVFATVDGKAVGKHFAVEVDDADARHIWPCVYLGGTAGTRIGQTNFGQEPTEMPFKYNIRAHPVPLPK